MNSHHLIGTGLALDSHRTADEVADDMGERVVIALSDVGFQVVSAHAAAFEGGGRTLVWILAESHLVIHLWHAEGFSTIDLHICDYTRSNAEKTESLRRRLEEICFAPGSETWRSLVLPQPRRA
jgi:S-adenosylmethionine/arginine decarboxylase-like enzyme